MILFAQLFRDLDETTRTNEKIAALERYFEGTPAADAAWALQFLSGRGTPRAVTSRQLREWTAAAAGLPLWLVEESYEAVGDLAETMALLLPDPEPAATGRLPLHRLVAERLLALAPLNDDSKRDLLFRTWRELDGPQRFVWNKLITGGFRVGVSRTLVVRALAKVAGVSQAVMAHRVLGFREPTEAAFRRLLSAEAGSGRENARPYPFYLASPVEELRGPASTPPAAIGNLPREDARPVSTLPDLGEPACWQAEWKWDGIRAQIIRRGDDILVWSRGDELVTETFPEIADAARSLADGTVLDGELIVWRDADPLPRPFAELQRRLGRKEASPSLQAKLPVRFIAYDLLEVSGQDQRDRPLAERRHNLEAILGQAAILHRETASEKMAAKSSGDRQLDFFKNLESSDTAGGPDANSPPLPLTLSPLLPFTTWDQLAGLRRESRGRGTEGVMLKRRDSAYAVGRGRGNWWKWKIDPFVIDAVLVAAQQGHGRRASLFTDYTFALWHKGELLPVAKAYSGLTDDEIRDVDAFIRANITGKFGPVRSVKPELVFELAFEGIQESSRHKSGVAVRFPRIHRRRTDKTANEADTLDALRRLAGLGAAS